MCRCHPEGAFVAPHGDEGLEHSSHWFAALSVLTAGALIVGVRLGRRSPRRTLFGIATGVLLLGAWVWLVRHPAVLVQVMPSHVLRYVEGVAAAPLFMLVLGCAWAQTRLPRQRRVVALAAVLGTVYFLTGGLWMIQTTPREGFARTVAGDVVIQSQDYSCVPAACATALNHLGMRATEADMAALTEARPGTGSTLIRAYDALNMYLQGTGMRAEIISSRARDLHQLPAPMLTPLRFESSRQHMVTVTAVDARGVWVADPAAGLMKMKHAEFATHFGGQVIVFSR